MATHSLSVSPITGNPRFDFVHSKDGTKIGYRQLGQGPGLVVVHGAMESAASHHQLAETLSSDFTVYLYDRRGRGASGPYGEGHCMQTEVEDIDALLTQTGARQVFGVSSGGLVALQAALALDQIDKVAVFEPPLVVNGSISTAFLPRFEREIAAGYTAAALVTGMLEAQMGPPIFERIPRRLLVWLTNAMMNSEDRKAGPEDVTWRKLAPTLRYDFRLVQEMAETAGRFSHLRADVLLLGGSVSPTYLKIALDALELAIPHAQRIVFPGLNHGGSGNRNRGGQPERVARELRHFFTNRQD